MISINDLMKGKDGDSEVLNRIFLELNLPINNLKNKYGFLKLDDSFWDNTIILHCDYLLSNNDLSNEDDVNQIFLNNLIYRK